MTNGWYRMRRGWLDHPALHSREPFDPSKAYAWLFEEAAWKRRRKHIDGWPVVLQRGQVAHSGRFMANAWGWKEPRVRRFLERLEREGLVQVRTDAHMTVVTLCDYDANLELDEQSDAPATQARRTRDANEKDKEEREEPKNSEGYAFGADRAAFRATAPFITLR